MQDDKRLDSPRYSVEFCQLPLLDGHIHKNSERPPRLNASQTAISNAILSLYLYFTYTEQQQEDAMPLSAFISWPWQPRDAFSQRLATTRRFLDKRHKPTPLPTAFRCSETTLNASAGNPSSKTFECSEEGWSNAQLRPVLSPPATPTNSSRHSLDGGENAPPKGQAFAVDKLKERLARIVAGMERSHQQPPRQQRSSISVIPTSTQTKNTFSRQQQPFIRALPNRIWSLVLGLSYHPRPDDDSGACCRSPEDPTPLRAAPETPSVCGLARQPSLGSNSDPQDSQHDIDVETIVDSDSDSATAVESDSGSYTSIEDEGEDDTRRDISDNTDADDTDTDDDLEDDISNDDNLCQLLLETVYRCFPEHVIEELMKAIFVDQLVNKTSLDPRRDLERLCSPGIQGYARELAEGIGKQLALEVSGLSTEAILDTALNQHQTWARPLRGIEQPRIFRGDLDQANKALKEYYIFVDEHNRPKRLKVTRACNGCRKRRIKCGAAKTDTWPCSNGIKKSIACVQPNAFDGANDSTTNGTTPMNPSDQYHATQPTYLDAGTAPCQAVTSDTSRQPGSIHYEAASPPAPTMEQQCASRNVFPTPPMQPEACFSGEHRHHDLADLLGTLKISETGTALYLRNKVSFRREEQPAIEDSEDYTSALPPLMPAPGLKIRIPPELMPDEETALHYFDLYFSHVHPYVPVLCKTIFSQQWNTDREAISLLILEAIFAIGERLAEAPTEGQQWLALASRKR
ncbi:hypothetical protein CDV36_016153, partial [Fusarium kuroshium]